MFDLIVAVSINNGIGKDNSIPWNIKPDLKYFKEITTKRTSSEFPFSKLCNYGEKYLGVNT